MKAGETGDTMRPMKTCPDCDGKGECEYPVTKSGEHKKKTCENCNGKGMIVDNEFNCEFLH